MSDEKVFPQSGVIPFREYEGRIEVLLITSQNGKRWVIPKGLIETELTPRTSAVQEAYEEAGIRGLVGHQPLGRYTKKKWGGICEIEVFAMLVTELLAKWPEHKKRDRKWYSVLEAAELLKKKSLKQIVMMLPHMPLGAPAGRAVQKDLLKKNGLADQKADKRAEKVEKAGKVEKAEKKG